MLIVTFGFAINVFADDITTTGANHVVTSAGNITITGADSSDTFTAYKLVDITYDSSTNSVGYQFNSSFETFLNSAQQTNQAYKTPNGGGTFTVANYMANQSDVVKAVGTAYLTYVKNNTVSGGIAFGQSPNAYNVATVPAGSYLISATSTKRVYKLMIGNVELESDGNNGYQVKSNTNVEAKGTDVADGVVNGGDNTTIVPVTDPTTGEPVIDPNTGEQKVVALLSNDDSNSDGSYGVGDTVTYDIDVTIPSYPDEVQKPQLTVTADIPGSIIFNGLTDGLKVYVGEDTNPCQVTSDGKVMHGGEQIAVARMIDSNGNTTTTPANADKVEVVFDTDKVVGDVSVEISGVLQQNQDLEVGSPSNITTVDVTYVPDPYKDETKTVSLDFGITTYGLKIDVNPPQGAGSGFITNVNAATSLATTFDVTNTATNQTIQVTTDASTGIGTYAGIAGGTYTVTQRSAISGYKLLGTRTITIPGDNMENDYYVLTLELETTGLLPSTGGIGTLLFSIIGILVIGMAFYFVIDYRKRKENVSAN